MKIFMHYVFMAILIVITICCLFGRLDAGLENDSLKDQIRLQRTVIHFMENIVNSPPSPFCKISVADFEKIADANENSVIWEGDRGNVWAFILKRKGSCIESINVIDGL